jgi:hypothetical protein
MGHLGRRLHGEVLDARKCERATGIVDFSRKLAGARLLSAESKNDRLFSKFGL